MPPLAQAAPADLNRELEGLLGMVMAWLGGDDAARPSQTQSGSLAEALGAALIALWEDRVAPAVGVDHSSHASLCSLLLPEEVDELCCP